VVYKPLMDRIRSEYAEMPGMRLTAAQVQRLCGVDRLICAAVLDALVEAKFLYRYSDGTYARSIGDSRVAEHDEGMHHAGRRAVVAPRFRRS
jgi:hypothetical protein